MYVREDSGREKKGEKKEKRKETKAETEKRTEPMCISYYCHTVVTLFIHY
jgi:hypothetical protein